MTSSSVEHIQSANRAYSTFVRMGPFYGKDIKDSPPTFRVSAQPIILTNEHKQTFQLLGHYLHELSKILPELPQYFLSQFDENTTFASPFTYRADVIIDNKNIPFINEINTIDGADALMITEQIAYGISSLSDSTAARLLEVVRFLSAKRKLSRTEETRLLWIAENTERNPYLANFRRVTSFLEELDDHLSTEIADSKNIRDTRAQIVYNSGYLPPKEIHTILGQDISVLSYGSWHALHSKLVFALLHNPELTDFFLIKNLIVLDFNF